jgi:hypothetical protein
MVVAISRALFDQRPRDASEHPDRIFAVECRVGRRYIVAGYIDPVGEASSPRYRSVIRVYRTGRSLNGRSSKNACPAVPGRQIRGVSNQRFSASCSPVARWRPSTWRENTAISLPTPRRPATDYIAKRWKFSISGISAICRARRGQIARIIGTCESVKGGYIERVFSSVVRLPFRWCLMRRTAKPSASYQDVCCR